MKKLILVIPLIAFLWFMNPTPTRAAPPEDPPIPPTEEQICKVVNDTRAHRDVHFANKSAKGYRIPDPLATSSNAWKQFVSATAERTSLPVETVERVWLSLVSYNGFGVNLATTVTHLGQVFGLFYDDFSRCPPPPPGAPASSGNELETKPQPHEPDTALMFAPTFPWVIGFAIFALILIFVLYSIKNLSRKGEQNPA